MTAHACHHNFLSGKFLVSEATEVFYQIPFFNRKDTRRKNKEKI